jgi:hypothetical protein
LFFPLQYYILFHFSKFHFFLFFLFLTCFLFVSGWLGK